jgi:hypothetical protein
MMNPTFTVMEPRAKTLIDAILSDPETTLADPRVIIWTVIRVLQIQDTQQSNTKEEAR